MNTITYRLISLSVFLAALCGTAPGCGGSSGPVLGGAEGVTISEIAVFQGIKRTLVKDGKEVTSQVPLIAGRETLVRVYYKTDSAYDQQPVTARLTLKADPPVVLEQTLTLSGESVEKDLASTINFYPARTLMVDPLAYSVELLQEGPAAADPTASRYPAEGYSSVTVEGKKNTLRLLLVPFRYKADGSDRLPDTSAAQLQRFKERFSQLYPVSDVEISLHAPIDWTKAIAGTGAGWQEVGMRLLQVRSEAKVSDDVYLYGFFNPADTLQKFCGWGCMLGVTLLNSTPAATGMVSLRLALGVGFTEKAVDTAAHEIGHSHGRMHANCGPGLTASSIDPGYPSDEDHKGGKIGVWGFNMVSKTLVPPTYADIMGYCSEQWISDYNYTALWNRGKNVNLEAWAAPPGGTYDYDLVSVELDGSGAASWAGPVARQRPLHSAEAVAVVLDGRRSVRGELFRFDHLPAAWLFLPRTNATTARFIIDGSPFQAQRQGR